MNTTTLPRPLLAGWRTRVRLFVTSRLVTFLCVAILVVTGCAAVAAHQRCSEEAATIAVIDEDTAREKRWWEIIRSKAQRFRDEVHARSERDGP